MAKIIPVTPFDFVIFGGTGDLSLRKLIPALYYRFMDGQFDESSRIVAVSRSDLDRESYCARAKLALKEFVAESDFDEDVWARFSHQLFYVAIDARGDHGWLNLRKILTTDHNEIQVFYLATSPDLFGVICEKLKVNNLIYGQSRVVLEKPIGRDLATARAINNAVAAVFHEQQIFRIDHFLGKETVQNLMALRFANSMFEPLWNSHYIDHVQITVTESVGLAGRAGYYNTSGAMRDMVQNHLLQLLCLVAMEPPQDLAPDAVRDEKLKVLRALKPLVGNDVAPATVRAQYRSGTIQGESVPGYSDELGEDSNTETFVALRTEVENWRWSGVPFYLRTGKRLKAKASEIVIQFRSVPHSIFPLKAGSVEPNMLLVRLQPDEGIQLHLMSKDPGPGGMRLRRTPLNLSFAEAFQMRYPDAYERLLMDVVRNNLTLFMRRDEVETAWMWSEPILKAWEELRDQPKPYTAGTWGPSASVSLIERDGRTWYDELL